METGSRQENASNQKSGAPFRFHRTGLQNVLMGCPVCDASLGPGDASIVRKRASHREASETREIARRDLGRSSDITRRARHARGHGSTRRCGRRRRGLTRRRAEPAEEIAQRRPVGLRGSDLHRRAAAASSVVVTFAAAAEARAASVRALPPPFRSARRRLPAYRPWPARGRFPGAARRNRRRGRPVPPALHPSPACAQRAHPPRRGASRDRRATDRCRRKRPPAA